MVVRPLYSLKLNSSSLIDKKFLHLSVFKVILKSGTLDCIVQSEITVLTIDFDLSERFSVN